MKKMNLVLGALLVSGMVFAGGRANEQEIALAAQATETEDTGIRAEAPQESSAQTEGMTGAQTDSADPEKALEEQMKTIALEDAGVKEEEATGIRVKKDRDDGRTVYEVTVYVDAEEYSYEIDADTGNILESDYEVDKDYDREPDNPDYLTREEVTEIVLEKVEGATEMDVRVTYEVDDGHEKYEGSIFYDQTEYEFEVNAQNGDIIEWSEEKFD